MAPRAAYHGARGSLQWDPAASAYSFSAEGVEYRVPIHPESPALSIEARGPHTPWQVVMAALLPTHPGRRLELLELGHQARGRTLNVTCAEALDGAPIRRSVEIRLVGQALELRARAAPGEPGSGYAGLSFLAGPGRDVAVPGLPVPLRRLPDGGFAALYFDRFRGGATAYAGDAALYEPDLAGALQPLDETLHVAFSPDPLEPLPRIDRPPAPRRAALETRLTIDFWSEASYAEDEEFLAELAEYGLRSVLLVYRSWDRFTPRRRDPAIHPAPPERGGGDRLRHLMARLRASGWLIALREEFLAAGSSSPYLVADALALGPDGAPRGGAEPGAGAEVRPLAANRMLEFARLEATEVQRNYAPDGVFVHRHTALFPSDAGQIDSRPGSVRSEAQAAAHAEELLQSLRQIHSGPLIGQAGEGPGRFDTFAAGTVEAIVARGPDGGAGAPLIVDYELNEVLPRLIGAGAGPLPGFCDPPAGRRVDPREVDWDAYRATEIALGHAGYATNNEIFDRDRPIAFPAGTLRNLLREYYLVRPLQELYVRDTVRSVRYIGPEGELTLAEALDAGLDRTGTRVRIEYGSGLRIWINRTRRDGWRIEERDCDLPPGGFLALSSRVLAFSAVAGGGRSDFCRCPEHTFVDARSSPGPRTIEGITTDGAAALLPGAHPHRPDVLLVGARHLQTGEEEYRASEPADLRIRHLSAVETEVRVLATVSGRPIHLTWPGPAFDWQESQVEVREVGGAAGGAPSVIRTRTGPQLLRARPGARYRISFRRA